ncbi:16S rRNA (guanine(527)-N(7))-methyltransferase RsmG [Piscinibacter gummiphilus]|uniref:Ribosomal RNA small subunit methyltransferase G n=1 Tax=Piscinibacter gummiphilus TaxID=946333 RepID=A0A1W6LH53_9BURK|nr:16S rRNA (guanine(527)-N(7))-methyltransferase RsmG [Piscinibacter gummiphilus]ARN23614.1 16S rRNA methyltransferase G [Piscinibacter gummiphilus]ATU68322.1 16S rRNA (guanine(527)-N(7))-methyltransferase RsmG [Piscinibacter gummiphilus]GLS98214.1 ribosomal RNA small subunit methyltransferase G [Piscinibacter gummiphilus]
MQPPESQALAAGLAALNLSLDEGQQSALLAYLALIGKWNKVYNLTAVRDPAEMLTLHLLDSLSVVDPLRRHVGDRPARVLDVGSGAGLPGVVLAIALPQLQVTCVDTVGKKASFIQQVASELRLRNLSAQHARVESMKIEPVDVVTSRAFASLVDFTNLTSQHLLPSGVWMAMKGKAPADETAALPPSVDVFHVEQLVVPGLDAERCLVWMRQRP